MHPPPPPPPARRSSVARGDSAQPAILGGAGTATLRSAPRLPPRGLRGRSASSLVRPCPGAATRRWHRRAPSERRATAGASSVYRLMIPSQPSPRKARAQMKECHKSPLPKKKKKKPRLWFCCRPPAPGEGPSCGTEAAPRAAGGREGRGSAAARSWKGRPDGRQCPPRAAGPELRAGNARWGDGGGSESRGAGRWGRGRCGLRERPGALLRG